MKNRKKFAWKSIVLLVGIIAVVAILAIVGNVNADTITVGSGGDYPTIQQAIDNASDGDTVFVYNGTYYENVIVNKTINLTGESKENTIIDGNTSGDVVEITADGVNISGFSIVNSGGEKIDSGIKLFFTENCTIKDNSISDNNQGIMILSVPRWKTPSVLGSENHYTALHAYDLDGDGIDEILAGNRSTDRAEIWSFNTSTEDWQLIDSTTQFPNDIHGITAGDYDEDDDIDIATALRFNGIYIVFNQSSGWSSPTRLDATYGNAVTTYDLNGDGHQDIFAFQDYGQMHIFYGNGDGTFNADRNPIGLDGGTPNPSMPAAGPLSIADLDGDGDMDLIGTWTQGGWGYYPGDRHDYFVRGFINNGTNASGMVRWGVNASEVLGYYTGNSQGTGYSLSASSRFGAGDINNDGYVDAVVWNYTESALILLRGFNDSGKLNWSEEVIDDDFPSSISINCRLGDINGDGNIDVIVGGYNNLNGLRVYYGDGRGAFIRDNITLGYGLYADGRACAVGDFNDDGVVDMAFPRYESGHDGFEVWLQNYTPSNNNIYHNNFINNTQQAFAVCSSSWDNNYPYGGNYWNDFNSPAEGAYDNNSDGIVDNPYNIPGGSNQDKYPLVHPYGSITNLNSGEIFLTIQAAIDNASERDTVKVEPGTYGSIVIDKPLKLIGDPVIDGHGGVGIQIQANNTLVENMTVVNSSTGVEIYNETFVLNNITLYNNTIIENMVGIWVNNTSHCNITLSNLSRNFVSGLILGNATHCNISYSVINGSSGSPASIFGILIVNSSYNSIYHNNLTYNNISIQIIGNWSNMFIPPSFYSWNTIDGNDIHFSMIGVMLNVTDNETIRRNNITYNMIGVMSGFCENITIERNNISSNIIAGIMLENTTYSTISYNELNGSIIFDGTFGGLCNYSILMANSSHNDIYKNNISGNLIGIHIIGNWNNLVMPFFPHSWNTIDENNISFNHIGVLLTGTDNETIIENNITHNAFAGIMSVLCENITVEANNISFNGWIDMPAGILFFYTNHSYIANNTITNNTGEGISLYDSSHNIIVENYIAYHGNGTLMGLGINISGNSDYTLIFGNTIIENSGGIYIEGHAEQNNHTKIHWNNIYNNTYIGVWYNSSSEIPYINATWNYWGAANGPGNFTGDVNDTLTGKPADGNGDNISWAIHFDPWSNASIEQSNYYELPVGVETTINLTERMQTTVVVNATGDTYMVISKYSGNPRGNEPVDIVPLFFIDVAAKNESAVKWPVNVTIYYTQEDLNNAEITEYELIGISFWNESAKEWQYYNDTGVNTTNQFGYAGYAWANVWHLTPLLLSGRNDALPPITNKTVGNPKYGTNDLWVNFSTPIWLNATDDMSGVNATYYRIQHNGGWHPNATDDYYGDNTNITSYNGSYWYVYYTPSNSSVLTMLPMRRTIQSKHIMLTTPRR